MHTSTVPPPFFRLALVVATMLLVSGCAGAPGLATKSPIAAPITSAQAPTETPAGTRSSAECAHAATSAPRTWSVSTGGQTRRALVHIPPVAASGEPLPVVLVFHGYGDAPDAVEAMTSMSVKADEAGFIAVYPAALGEPSKWDFEGASDTTFARDLITKTEQDLCVDPARIYATGMSLGGGMANVVGCRLADLVAAIAPVSGVYGPNWGGTCRPARPVPVIAFHGTLDPIVPYGGGPIIDPDHGAIPELPPVVGVEAWAAGWATANGCEPKPQEQPRIGEVVPTFWRGCDADVELYEVLQGGHTWPGSPWQEPMTARDISATDLIWEFFAEH